MNRDKVKKYGKIAGTGVVGAAVGAAGIAGSGIADDKATNKQVKNLKDQVKELKDTKKNLQKQVDQLDDRPTRQKVEDLRQQIETFNQTIKQLREENADLEDTVTQAQERVGLVDYMPVFQTSDVELTDVNVTVDNEAEDGNGEYDAVYATYKDLVEYNVFDVEIRQFEDSEDAADYVNDKQRAINPVTFTGGEDAHTVSVTVNSSSSLNELDVNYEEAAVANVDSEDDIKSVTVNGEDVTEHVTGVESDEDKQVDINFDGDYSLNEGDTVTVTYEDTETADTIKKVMVNNKGYNYEDGDNSFVYRDGNTVVYGTATEGDDNFDNQYQQFVSQYE